MQTMGMDLMSFSRMISVCFSLEFTNSTPFGHELLRHLGGILSLMEGNFEPRERDF